MTLKIANFRQHNEKLGIITVDKLKKKRKINETKNVSGQNKKKIDEKYRHSVNEELVDELDK